jgi:transcriptional regulator with XRE-family HTH domain
VPFSPPPLAVQSAVRPDGTDWYSCGWRDLDAWRTERNLTYRELADKLGCAAGGITGWKNGRPPSGLHLDRIEALARIDRDAWTWWTQDEPLDASARPSSPPPASERRAAAPPAETPLGTTPDELRASASRCKALAKQAGLSPTQQAQLEGKTISALTALARLEERQAIHEHPDFAPLVEDLVLAVRSALGPDAPDGIESRIADELERLQATRSASAMGRAA